MDGRRHVVSPACGCGGADLVRVGTRGRFRRDGCIQRMNFSHETSKINSAPLLLFASSRIPASASVSQSHSYISTFSRLPLELTFDKSPHICILDLSIPLRYLGSQSPWATANTHLIDLLVASIYLSIPKASLPCASSNLSSLWLS